MAKVKNKNTIPDLVSLTKRINISDAVMDNVVSYIKGSRTATSQEGGSKNKAEEVSTNLIASEIAEASEDEVIVRFNMQVLPFKNILFQTNDVEFYEAFNNTLTPEKFQTELKKIANYLAYNILSAKWLWRNRVIAENITINVMQNEKSIIQNYDVVLKENLELDNANNLKNSDKQVELLANKIYEIFNSEKTQTFSIEAKLEVYKYQKLYPSQIFEALNTQRKEKSDISREFYKSIDKKLAISAEKVWNAIRTFDVWYKDYEKLQEPISIEFLGNNLKFQNRFRVEKESFATYLEKIIYDKDSLNESEILYTLGCLVRGGAVTKTKTK